MINPEDITLRPATDADSEFLKKLAPELLPNGTKIIELNYNPIGVLAVDNDAVTIFCGQKKHAIIIDKIEILYEYRRQGIGTTVLNNELLKAIEQQKPVVLKVYQSKFRELDIYENLGFINDGVPWENPETYRMVWHPEKAGFAPIRRIGVTP